MAHDDDSDASSRRAPAWTGWPATGGLLALATGLHALAFANLPLVPKNDSVWYLGLSHGLARERIFDLYAVGDPTAFDIHYTPGYPLLLDAVRWLAGWEGLAQGVLLAQHAAAIASVLVLHRLGVALGRPGAGALAALAYALFFPALLYSHVMISETLFTFLALSGAWAMARTLPAPSAARLLGTGAVLGLATLVRPLAAFEAAAFGALLAFLPGPAPLVARARQVALLGVLPIALLGAALVHNHATYGRATLSDVSGRHLIDRVWGFDGTVARDGPATRRVVEACRRSGFAHEIPGDWWDFWKALRAGSGLDTRGADDLLRTAALEAIAADPWRYVSRTPLAVWHLLSDPDTWPPPLEQTLTPERFAGYLDLWTRTPAEPRRTGRSLRAVEARRDFRARVPIEHPGGGPAQRWWLVAWRDLTPSAGPATALAFLLAALALARFGRRGDWVPVLVVAALLVPPAFLEYPWPRYRQPAVPAILLVVAAAALECAHRLRGARSRR